MSPPVKARPQSPVWPLGPLAIVLLFLPLACFPLPATPSTNHHLVHSNYARQVYLDKQALSEKNNRDLDAAWDYAKACFDYADFSLTDSQREPLALQGIRAARRAIHLAPTSAQAHYTLALNLGQLARTRTLTALQLVQEMEREFLKAIELDPKIDHAGPHRALGVLYRDAPGWPVSLGNRKKAQSHLQKAITLFPQYPGNTLSFLEALLAQGEDDKVCQKIPATQKMLDQARLELTGPAWSASWAEWDSRWIKIQSKTPCNP